jgi:hypothetical protein
VILDIVSAPNFQKDKENIQKLELDGHKYLRKNLSCRLQIKDVQVVLEFEIK